MGAQDTLWVLYGPLVHHTLTLVGFRRRTPTVDTPLHPVSAHRSTSSMMIGARFLFSALPRTSDQRSRQTKMRPSQAPAEPPRSIRCCHPHSATLSTLRSAVPIFYPSNFTLQFKTNCFVSRPKYRLIIAFDSRMPSTREAISWVIWVGYNGKVQGHGDCVFVSVSRCRGVT